MTDLTGHPVADAIAGLPLAGNIVNHSWYQEIRYTNKRGTFTDPWACLILADIVYWYRPVEIRDEFTGQIKGYRKKFAEDKLQRSPEAFAELVGCSTKVARCALDLLEELGLIDIELRAVHTGFGVIPTAMFIGLNAERLIEITYSTKPESTQKSFSPKSVRRDAQIGNKPYPNRQQALPKSATSLTQIGNLSIYKDFSETSLESTQREEGDRPLEEKTGSEQRQPVLTQLASQSHQQESSGQTEELGSGSEDSAPFFSTTKKYQHGGHAANERFNGHGELPPWKTGYGPNDWNYELLQDIVDYWNQSPGKNFTVSSVMGFIGERKSVTHSKHAQLLQTCKEAQEFGDEKRRKRQETQQAIAAATAPSEAEHKPSNPKVQSRYTQDEWTAKLRGMGIAIRTPEQMQRQRVGA